MTDCIRELAAPSLPTCFSGRLAAILFTGIAHPARPGEAARRQNAAEERIVSETYYRHHVFFCTNQREAGRACCNNHGATDLCAYTKARLQKRDLWGRGGVRVSAAGCLGRCAEGPNVVVYPEGVWYRYAGKEDIDAIIEEHLAGGRIVERLRTPLPSEKETTG